MCHAVTCKTCGRPTWKGCGDHIEQALAHVPAADRCQCPRAERPAAGRSPLQRLFGR
jgi:hypothetical protein